MIERDRAVGADTGNGLRDHLRPLACLNVVGLQDETSHPVVQEFPGAIDVVNPAADDVRPDVDLKIVGALQRVPRRVGDGR